MLLCDRRCCFLCSAGAGAGVAAAAGDKLEIVHERIVPKGDEIIRDEEADGSGVSAVTGIGGAAGVGGTDGVGGAAGVGGTVGVGGAAGVGGNASAGMAAGIGA